MNIVYIHTHDSGRVISPYGYDVPTDNLQKFAEDALTFRQCYSAAPTCSPSRAALLSGTYPHQNGMLGLAQRGFEMDYSKHLVQYLNKHKYHTTLCGIQHESGWYLNNKKEAYKIIGYNEDITTDNSKFKEEELGLWDYENALEASRWIEKYKEEKPFFLSFGMFSTHRKYPDLEEDDQEIDPNYVKPPLPTPDNKVTRKDFAQYMKSVKCADNCLEVVINALKEKGIYNDTIIIFTTDHGIASPYAKCTLFDPGIGVSFIIRHPASPKNGSVTDALISHVDVFPTICDLIHIEKPDYLEGTSFHDILFTNKENHREDIYAQVNFHTSYEPSRCVRTNRYKYIRYYDKEYLKINLSNIDSSKVKEDYMDHNIHEEKKYEEALYDLYYDIGERNNLVDNPLKQDVLQDMRNRMCKYQNETGDTISMKLEEIQPQWKVNKRTCVGASSKNPEDYISLGN